MDREAQKDLAALGFSMLVVGLFIGAMLGGVLVSIEQSGSAGNLDQRYIAAIDNSMVGKLGNASSGLNPVTQDNPKLSWKGEGDNASVLVVIFTRFNSSYPVGQNVTTWWDFTWVTLAPDVKDFFATHSAVSVNKTVRLAQLLGLPPNTKNTYLVEVWVKPKDLFRPSGDPEINDTTASMFLNPSANATYRTWFTGNVISSYYPKAFPWTRLGYTYDWGNGGGTQGLSEYVIWKSSIVQVKSVSTVDQYLAG
ncbi:MAG: hypothetical protein LUO79_00535 [Methanomassiliicoccales archaeon]|nr:hypothetical protein [Methanomassiliicoccales archaeon]